MEDTVTALAVWALDNGWTEHPARTLGVCLLKGDKRINLRKPGRVALEQKVALTAEEKKTDSRNMKWKTLEEHALAEVSVAAGAVKGIAGL